METLTCDRCGEFITEVYPSYGYVGVGEHSHGLYMVRLKEDDHVYRFFCTKCGAPKDWRCGIDFLAAISDYAIEPGKSIQYSSRKQDDGWPFAIVPQIESVDAILNFRSPSDEIRKCATTFVSNISWVNAVGQFAILVSGLQRMGSDRSIIMSNCRVLETARSGCDPGIDLDSPWTRDFITNYLERAALDNTPISSDLLQKINRMGAVAVKEWSRVHRELAEGVHTILLAQITLAWTAFEVLSSDLWIIAVNERPSPLAVNFAESSQGPSKSISLTALSELGAHDFNLSRLMGTLFLQQKKVDFTSLSSTKFAYEKAFKKRIPALDTPELKLLELVRNLVLHRAGVVDQAFLDGLQRTKLRAHPDCVSIQVGALFPISADLVTRLVESAVDAGKALLKFTLGR